jgi:lysophospholipase L1-like esterase
VLRALGVRVLDHRDLYRDADSLFKDQDHLNRRGARLFAARLHDDLRPLDE